MKYKLYKIRIIIRKVIIAALFVMFISTSLFVFNGLLERGAVNTELENFKKRGVLDKTTEIQGQKVDMYKVYPFYDYEDAKTFVFDDSITSKYYIGSSTDIVLTNRNPLRNSSIAIVKDVADMCSRFFYIGHATINLNEDGSELIESVGNDDGFKGVRIEENTWIYTEVRYGNDAQTIIGLRIKGISKESKENICNYLRSLEGKEYNYLLPFYHRDRYYCTDLISRALKKEKIYVNYDGLYTTGNDIIVSNNTYVIFLCERIEDGYFKIYYLSEE